MSRDVRLIAAAVLACVALAGCAPAGGSSGDGDRTVDVRGTITRTAASSGPQGWILETDGGILLALDLPGTPEVGGHCVTIAVDDDFPDVTDQDEVVAALQKVSEESGEALTVTGFC